MKRVYCVDSKGFDDLLVEGEVYLVSDIAAHVVRVALPDGTDLLCAADRFRELAPC